MRKIVAALLIALIVTGVLFAEEHITTSDGRQIVLRDNGTYEILESKEEIRITLVKVGEDQSWSGDTLTVLTFKVENFGYGTIHLFKQKVHVYDDRGKEYEDYAFSNYIDTTDTWSNTYIAKGSFENFEVKVEGDYAYVHEVVLDKVTQENISMRMLPEDIDINRIIVISSAIPEIIVRKQ